MEVELTQRYIITFNESFDETYLGNDGERHSRGPLPELARDIVIRCGEDGRPLSMTDGYADLPDDACEIREIDFDSEVSELSPA